MMPLAEQEQAAHTFDMQLDCNMQVSQYYSATYTWITLLATSSQKGNIKQVKTDYLALMPPRPVPKVHS